MATLREMINAVNTHNLMEYVDPEKTEGKIGDLLRAKFKKDRTVDTDTDVKSFIANVSRHIDPTDNHQYTMWILRMYYKNGIRLHEDLDRASVALAYFHQNKRQMPIKDINQIKQLSDLEEMVSKVQPQQSGKQEKKDTSARIKEETKVFYKGEEGMIVIPETQDASCFWGKGTKWCTASSQSHNYFDSYSSDGPLYIILPKDGTKWQLHVESNQFLDAQDQEFDINMWAEEYPWAQEALKDVYPRLNSLSYLRTKLDDRAFADEVYARQKYAQGIPSIEGIEGDRVILERWRDFEQFAEWLIPDKYSDMTTMDRDTYIENFDEEIKVTPSFEQELLGLLSDQEKHTIAHDAQIPPTDSNVFSAIMEHPEYIDDLAGYVFDVSDKSAAVSADQMNNALIDIFNYTLDEHRAHLSWGNDGELNLVMDLDDFANGIDANEEPEGGGDESFSLYDGDWYSAENTTFDEIIDDAENYSMTDQVNTINKFVKTYTSQNIILAPEHDTKTKDMFGTIDHDRQVMEVPQSVIMDLAYTIKKDIRMNESKKRNDPILTEIKKLAGM